MMRGRILLTGLIFFSSISFALAQGGERADLERQRKALQAELKEVQQAYNQIRGQTKKSLGQLNLVKRKIELQEQYINNINREIKVLNDDIYKSNIEIFRLEKQLDTLKSQYASSVLYVYKNRSSYDYVNFIFSADNFNDAIRRIAYLRSYRNYREEQVNTINETQSLITKRQQQQKGRIESKNVALGSRTTERNELAVQQKEKNEVVSKLKAQEKDLQQEIAAKKKKDRALQNSIAAIVRRDIERAKKEEAARRKAEEDRLAAERKAAAEKNTSSTTETAKKTASTPAKATEAPATRPKSYLELNKADVTLGADFESNKGRLPWPVDGGYVKIPFGMYTIEGTNLRDDNPGITIATQSAGMPVKAVFDGVVSGVDHGGGVSHVIVRHGKYYTVYSNMSGVKVSKDQQIKRGQVLGSVAEAYDGDGGELLFMMMRESSKVNPSAWLNR